MLQHTTHPLQAQHWNFAPERDAFSSDSLLDLRELNERTAGEKGWVQVTADGDFALGNGQSVRFWAVNTGVARDLPFVARPRWSQQAPDLHHHARWLAKRGVNMVRCHSHINPDLNKHPHAKISDANMAEVEWIWRTVAAMKQQGIYTTVSPYWANSMKSDDPHWGTSWNGNHHGLLFFNPTLQAAYKEWLRVLFTTRTPHLGGKTLAEEPALAIFQIQNEDSLLFWTVQNLDGPAKQMIGKQFATWASTKYGSLNKAITTWGGGSLKGDALDAGVLDLQLVWHLTSDAQRKGAKRTPRLNDQLQFLTETMHSFHVSMARFVREDLNCPVLINAGNWKTADDILLNDAERYSYTANEVLACNRYFGGIHQGKHRGWAIVKGDRYTSESVTAGAHRKFPLNLKQVHGHPMLVTESAWVFPNEYAAEAPFLVSVYSSLTGVDAYYWFATGTDEWTPPQSANGYLPSQGKWIFSTPEMAGQFPAAALSFRLDYVRRAKPAVSEHRALTSIWNGRTPVIAETSGFDPNRDAGDIAAGSSVKNGVDPAAFFMGPVEVHYGSPEKHTRVSNIARHVKGGRIQSLTGEVSLDTTTRQCTVNAARCQGVTGHFGPNAAPIHLTDVDILCKNRHATVMLVSMDGKAIQQSGKLLVQVGTLARPSGWKTQPVQIKAAGGGQTIDGREIIDYGGPPWQVRNAMVQLRVRNTGLRKATVLDMNGMPVRDIPLTQGRFDFPQDAMYVLLR
ncbi:hypothetical protein HW115_09830 [Verrucomicrobiaceae bacterium N1E253]|uniref:Glycoside hydrolase family 42 N-terminal domain-containing protein n=1 Tax=Oceaniferula marina TaxID=2748318 RepID=A0A851GJ65_9BACT|nr:hypothetical protein [Oceaniferula marina]NWK55911.1 hypothetical protein [Oceaniferula marina]